MDVGADRLQGVMVRTAQECEFSLRHAGNGAVVRWRVGSHVCRGYRPAAQRCGSFLDAHPAGRTAELGEVTSLDVATLSGDVFTQADRPNGSRPRGE